MNLAEGGIGDDPATAYCAEQVRRHDYDRWLTALFAPVDRRPALLALYAFNLEVARTREQVSEPMLGEIRLQWWRDTIQRVLAGKAMAQPVAEALLRALPPDIGPELFERLLDARAQDLYETPPATLSNLEAYAADTAASLNELGLAALGVQDAESRAAARAVGIAWALTGLLRALPQHAALRRLHLPADLMAAAGLDAEQVFRDSNRAGVVRVAEEIADQARTHLGQARQRRPDPKALPVLLPAALADLYLAKLQKAGFDPHAPGLEVSGPRKQLRLLAKAALRRF
jgi:phytoene synthase